MSSRENEHNQIKQIVTEEEQHNQQQIDVKFEELKSQLIKKYTEESQLQQQLHSSNTTQKDVTPIESNTN